MPSFTQGDGFGTPKRRAWFVSFSVASTASGASACSQYGPSVRCVALRTSPLRPERSTAMCGFAFCGNHDQSFLNHSVGRRCSGAGARPRLIAVMRTRTSSGPAFAYSTNTSK